CITCRRKRRSADSLRRKRPSANSRRSVSTWARSSGVPAPASNSHTARPRNPFVDRSHADDPPPPPSPTFSLHIPPASLISFACIYNTRANETSVSSTD
ncbi:hypothetical protein BRADI_3g03471v3, partial [Brachypodium distachyon]